MQFPSLIVPCVCWLVGSLVARADIADQLAGYWPLNETGGLVAHDASGAGNDAGLSNFPAGDSQWIPGVSGAGLSLAGATGRQYARVADYAKATDKLTVSAWVWAEARPTSATIAKNWSSTGPGQFQLGLFGNSGYLDATVATAAGVQVSARDTVPLPLAVWTHVALVADGQTLRLYRDGTQVASAASSGALKTGGPAALGIGARLNGAGTAPDVTAPGYWQGRMDEVAVWNRDLGPLEIAGIYAAGLENRGPLAPKPPSSGGAVFLSEFMAANSGVLADEDGDYSDWIEISNTRATAADLGGWFLTDDASKPAKWSFPKTNLAAKAQLLVFASGKNRQAAGRELHANFSLSSRGEYLALFDAATNLVSEFAPLFPPQAANVSFGASGAGASVPLVTEGSPVRVFVAANDGLGDGWLAPNFDDSGWRAGTNGVGFDAGSGKYAGIVQTDIGVAMRGRNASCLIRLPFVVEKPDDLTAWKLRMQYDDGFAVWLNGQELFRRNAPETLAWNSAATLKRTEEEALVPEEFELGGLQEAVTVGTNVLAIQALNVSADDANLLAFARLEAVSRSALAGGWRYFLAPTPGKPNNVGTEVLGPLVQAGSHAPLQPVDDDDLSVTARVTQTLAPVGEVLLRYRVMFSNEVAVAMMDDGLHRDGAAGDGIYGALVPAAASKPGEMVRYRITASDTEGHSSRWPLFQDPKGSPEYRGTVVADPGLTNVIPVLHWFAQSKAAASTDAGTRCSVFYGGEFYDNIFVRIRGGTSRGWPKLSHKLEFNEGEHFRIHPDLPRVSEIDLNTTYTDKSYLRAVLHYESQRDAGMPSPEAFHVRLQQNNAFFSVAIMTEQPDSDFLRRHGLDDQGALYKCGPGSTYDSVGSFFEKKTRRNEGTADITALINGLRLTGAALEKFVFDQIDLPGMVNFMATVAIAQNIDASDKNHFLYRDTRGSREWFMLPWDLDLSFGPNALNTDTMVYKENYTSHPFIGASPYLLAAGKYNRLLEAVVKVPRGREMVLRRIRTLNDQFLSGNYFSNRIDQLYANLLPDVLLDRAKWGANAHFPGTTYTFKQASDRIKTEYLKNRPGYLKAANIPGITTANPAAQPEDATLEIGAIDANPPGGNQAQEYVEIRNTNAFAVDLSGWRVAGAIEHKFKPSTVIPSKSSLYLAPDASEFRARPVEPHGGQGLFVQGGYKGRLSARGGRLAILDQNGREAASQTYAGSPSPAQKFLRITELMFNPAAMPGDLFDAQEYEFVAVANIGTEPLDLTGVKFSNGIEFDFSASAAKQLGAGQTFYIAKNIAAFRARYGSGATLAGAYAGQLDNSGEKVVLTDAANEVILEVDYSDKWIPRADGEGWSLVCADPAGAPEAWGTAANWRASSVAYGTPAEADTDGDGSPDFQEIVAGYNSADATNRPGFDHIRLDDSGVTLSFQAAVGRHYRVWRTDSLRLPGWAVLGEFPAQPQSQTLEIADPKPAAASRFYRLEIWR